METERYHGGSALGALPQHLVATLQGGSGLPYLEVVATALRTQTDALFPQFQGLAADAFAQWTSASSRAETSLEYDIVSLSTIARILPLTPYLTANACQFLQASKVRTLLDNHGIITAQLENAVLCELLLAFFRLLSHDLRKFRDLIPPVFLSVLFQNDHLPTRYLAVACMCQVIGFADATEQKLLAQYLGKQEVVGQWEGELIDFRLLKLYEEQRWVKLSSESALALERLNAEQMLRFGVKDLQPQVASFEGVLLPRCKSDVELSSRLVKTSTTRRNLRSLGQALQSTNPILVLGSAGSGKSLLIDEAARLMGQRDSMITLHLNDQTDAKSLLGVYVSSADGKGFSWQPGVLTKAVREGRWILIEDINRISGEVAGILRPLVENTELFLPSRKERLLPHENFRLLGTITTFEGTFKAGSTTKSLLNTDRLWQKVRIEQAMQKEVIEILTKRFPSLSNLLPQMWQAHSAILAHYQSDTRFRDLQNRLPSLRDLQKWCARASRDNGQNGKQSSKNNVSEDWLMRLLKNGIDLYTGHLESKPLAGVIASTLGRCLNIPPAVATHVLDHAVVALREDDTTVQIGRTKLEKITNRRKLRNTSIEFANTRQARGIMEAVSASVASSEPLLLVGETGVGKTTIVQHIANSLGQALTVVNLSQQSEATDLLGGLKPITTRSLLVPLMDRFNSLFEDTFNVTKNEDFRSSITKAFVKQRWPRVLSRWDQAVQMAKSTFERASPATVAEDQQITKRRRLDTSRLVQLRKRWDDFEVDLESARGQIARSGSNQLFSFVESRLVQAVRSGEWLLLDEINLASAEALDHVLSLLQSDRTDGALPFLQLTEAGMVEKIQANPNFRLFAAMNPATDAGKKDLPPAVRSQFTELYIHSGDDDLVDLTLIVEIYLGNLLDSDKTAATNLAKTYLALKAESQTGRFIDGAGDVPHYSLRSLTRCLQYTKKYAASYGLRRSMYEGLQMSFCTVLDNTSRMAAQTIVERELFARIRNVRALLSKPPKPPSNMDEFAAFSHHYVLRGSLSPDEQQSYIRTQSVEQNLTHLARATSMRRFPILLQGPTSAGKTSMVEFLARYTGNKFVRINNHEHTDLQEYLGTYASGSDGQLEYTEGVLVEALRKGHWIVLDELNLAPSDVLEALNRLLDDNRELLIPETQEIVRPHPNFMLFATQNPAGLYGGRKRLSRAFRNRFIEIHVDDIPENELETILGRRAHIPESFCKQIVKVYKSLSLQRQSTRLFEQRNSFATLRDLFRWASRPIFDRQELANHGFMLLGERVRNAHERSIVKSTIEETLKVRIDEGNLYGLTALPSNLRTVSHIVWTPAMRRLFVLVSSAISNNEPVLLIGETGCGKTQICQTVATAMERHLDIYNAHSNTESSDLIGSQRPIRHKSEIAGLLHKEMEALSTDLRADSLEQLIDKFKTMDTSSLEPRSVEKVRNSIATYQSLFAWSDGSLVQAMKTGNHFLLDEISLADDSVLERLNSVLEPSRTILLAEKGARDNIVVAHSNFQFLATMNPGGDYGKRELSAALRNRLTEIWVPPLSEDGDILPILEAQLGERAAKYAPAMLEFAKFFQSELQDSNTSTISLRSLLAWVHFIRTNGNLGLERAFSHGCALVHIDSLGANPAGMLSQGPMNVSHARLFCMQKLSQISGMDVGALLSEPLDLAITENTIDIGGFFLERTKSKSDIQQITLQVPTTLKNAMRLLRAMYTNKPVLLEGNPGVGKTALVSSLANLCGKSLARVNLSDQTDLMDLFGSDAPAEGEAVGSFEWQDGPLLRAMQEGCWILLDEMNLASQSVLEGLNACLDHRKEVYISELDKTFTCHPSFKLFATQNPHHQGGGRKGLPASFVNRFTVVYADPLEENDLTQICQTRDLPIELPQLQNLVSVIGQCQALATSDSQFMEGGPWELNLRDLNRWLDLITTHEALDPVTHFNTVIAGRFRSPKARKKANEIAWSKLWPDCSGNLYSDLSPRYFQIGTSFLSRDEILVEEWSRMPLATHLLQHAKAVSIAVFQKWPVILSGSSGSGKTMLIRTLAKFCGANLTELAVSADTDTADLVGGYEQYDSGRDLRKLRNKTRKSLTRSLAHVLTGTSPFSISNQLHALSLLGRNDEPDISKLRDALACSESTTPELLPLLEHLKTTHEANKTNGSARFVWNDGPLIDALEEGSWLILDNANLCNASVLDRLNSLLEPNGVLSVDEQHGANGGSRIVKPHPNFRIFLTTDTANGELSRAMRNRSLEICLDEKITNCGRQHLPAYPASSDIARLRPLFQLRDVLNTRPWSAVEPWISQLSAADHKLLASFIRQRPDVVEKAYAQLNAPPRNRELLHHAGVKDFVQGHLPVKMLLNEPFVDLSHFQIAKRLAEDQMRMQFSASAVQTCSSYLWSTSNPNESSSLTSVLQKSYNASRSSLRSSATSFPPIYDFYKSFISILEKVFSVEQDATGLDTQVNFPVAFLSRVTLLLMDMMNLFAEAELDESKLQAYMKISTQILQQYKADASTMMISQLEHNFQNLHSPLRLRSGKHMQSMWYYWKPKTAKNEEQYAMFIRLGNLLAYFDEVGRESQQPLSALATVRLDLVRAQGSMLKIGALPEHLSILENAVEEISRESSTIHYSTEDFVPIFTAIRATFSLHHDSLSPEDQQLLQLLVRPGSEASQIMISQGSPTQLLERIDVISEGLRDNPLDSRQFLEPVDVATQLYALQNHPIGSLEFTTERLRTLRKFLTSQTDSLTRDVLPAISELSRNLVTHLIASVSEMTIEDAKSQLDQLSLKGILPSKLEDQERAKLHVAADCLARDDMFSQGLALLLIAEVAIRLFVPDKAFDPVVYPTLIRERHLRRDSELQERISAYRDYQLSTTGQRTSAVIRLLEADLADLGELPPEVTVYRPSKTRLNTVQAEFSNLLRTIIEPDIVTKMSQSGVSVAQQLASQLSTRIKATAQRLQNVSQGYNDLVRPILGFLNTMLLGTKLVIAHSETSTTSVSSVWSFALSYNHQQLQTSVRNLGSRQESIQHLSELTLQAALVTSDDDMKASIVDDFVQTVDYLYLEWKQNLSADQAKAAAQSKYYTYRGIDDDAVDEDELNALFPQFDDEKSSQSGLNEAGYDSRLASIQVAKLHRTLMICPEAQSELSSFLRAAVKEAKSSQFSHHMSMSEGFASILLQLEQKIFNLTSSSYEKFNVYSESNVNEVKKLLKLIDQCEFRFRRISSAWPEHAVPVEILDYCLQTVRMSLKDPIAKLLTRVEKLLDLVSQWQSVASREFSVLDLVESLTALIIQWRKLELSSWSRLLDEEVIKHREDTESWYFIAYEAVLHNSASIIHQGGDVSQYCVELATTLQEFFTNVSLGSFEPRLDLLRILEATLLSLEAREPLLRPISSCVGNVIAHYSRYTEHVDKLLSDGCMSLEKDINEQIKLASWKDTNVAALRESARRSHFKLFKIVKKYRNLLGQPLTVFKPTNKYSGPVPLTSPSVTFSLPPESQLQSYVHAWSSATMDWSSRPARLKDSIGAAKSIERLLNIDLNAFTPAEEIADQLVELSGTVTELRNATPNILTDANSVQVRDLKQRKRRLLTDTMKSLSEMGIRRNLGTTELSTQSSAAILLASSLTPTTSQSNIILSAGNDAFHELLDIMPQARSALVEHSEELTDGEVRRGAGLLEGLLSHILHQRRILCDSYAKSQGLRQTCLALSNMHGQPLTDFRKGSSAQDWEVKHLLGRVLWLSKLLKLYAHVANLQVKHGGLTLEAIVTAMETYAEQLESNHRGLQSLAGAFKGIQSLRRSELVTGCREIVSSLREEMQAWASKEPNIKHITKQLLPWTEFTPEPTKPTNGVQSTSLQFLDGSTVKILNSVFVAAQAVTATQDKLPSTSEHRAWLTESVNIYSKTLQSFQIAQVTKLVDDMIENLVHVDQQDLQVALSMLLAASPVLNQYQAMYTSTQDKLERTYLETCRFAVYLAKTFASLSKEGFCTPAESAEGEEQSGKVESGTGLGDGDAAEDISKDVGDEEDLSELAQENGECEDGTEQMDKSKDAVDMGMDDLEGEMGSGDEADSEDGRSGNDSADEEDKQIDEETGSVDGLDPTAVDEKMWEDMQKDTEKEDKEMKSQKQQGQKSEENAARDGDQQQQEADNDLEAGEDQDEEGGEDEHGQERPEGENLDPHLDQQETLELPEDMHMDGKDSESDAMSDMDMDDMSDVGDSQKQPEEAEDEDIAQDSKGDATNADEIEESENHKSGQKMQDEELDQASENKDDEDESKLGTRDDDTTHEVDQQQEGEAGVADQGQDDEEQMQTDENAPSGVSNDQQATADSETQNEEQSQAEEAKGAAQSKTEQGTTRDEKPQEQPKDAFQRLAEVIKQYHQRREILTASEDRQNGETDKDIDMAEADFEHIDGEEHQDETQALGSTDKQQAQDLRQGQAIEDQHPDTMEDLPMPDDAQQDQNSQEESLAEKYARINAAREAEKQERDKAIAPQNKADQLRKADRAEEQLDATDNEDDSDEHRAKPNQPLNVGSALTGRDEAQHLWSLASARTQALSLVLTEQLRLILQPTTATKLRGDFRTGKRLNMRRIIPYIASGYKKDKIWMRRSVPSKRNYQVMLAVDDSKSMAESGADVLALETLCLVSRALSGLEVGDVSILAFGQEYLDADSVAKAVRVAHPFSSPFVPSHSGPEAFRHFSFQQRATNVQALLHESIALFGDARLKSSAREAADLWQLQLIISDGHIGSDHDAVRRLVRKAREERIMCVFVIVDAGQESIVDLKEVYFERVKNERGGEEDIPRTRRYLENFPFQYYVVVKEVGDLPGVLCTVLRGWFESVVESG